MTGESTSFTSLKQPRSNDYRCKFMGSAAHEESVTYSVIFLCCFLFQAFIATPKQHLCLFSTWGTCLCLTVYRLNKMWLTLIHGLRQMILQFHPHTEHYHWLSHVVINTYCIHQQHDLGGLKWWYICRCSVCLLIFPICLMDLNIQMNGDCYHLQYGDSDRLSY